MSGRVSTSQQIRYDLWKSYQVARSTHQIKSCFDTLAAYIKVWVESEAESVIPSPMISSSCDRYGYLKPSLAFDQPGEVWLLSNLPSGLLTSLQIHVNTLIEKLSSKTLAKKLETGRSSLLERAGHVTLALARMGGALYNYSSFSEYSENIMKSMLTLLQTLLNLFKHTLSVDNVLTVTSTLQYGVTFFHCIVDPQRKWQKNFMRLHNVGGVRMDQIITVPRSLSDIFITIFSEDWEKLDAIKPEEKEAWSDLQVAVLHMMGAVFFSSNLNFEPASSDKVCLMLLTLFDPREECTPIQVMATKVFVKVVHVIHNAVAETQIGVDSAMMLVTFLNVLSPRYNEGKLINPCIAMVTTLLDSIPCFLDSGYNKYSSPGPVTESLKKLFVEVGCYEKICEVLKLVESEARDKPDEARQLVCGIFRAFSAVTKNCPSTRQDFEQRVAQAWLFGLITDLISPTEEVLQEALNMVVEENYVYNSGTHTVFNTSAIKMLFRWLSSLSHPLQLWLVKRLYDMCELGSHNRQRCCISGILKTILEVLTTSQQPGSAFQEDVEGTLIDTVEVLGTHSIQTGELKQLIGSLRSLDRGKLPTYYYRLQKSLTVMADSGSEGVAPLYYFDLRTEDAYISIPGLKSFPATSSSLSFHMWVWLDSLSTSHARSSTLSDLDRSPVRGVRKKRMLYSFYANSGTGFEAFFTSTETNDDCVLVVATVTKKEFITLALNEFILDKQCWYSIAIVYSVSKRPWGKSELQIYVNGELKKITVMKVPNLSDIFTSSLIGFGTTSGGTRSSRNIRETTPPYSSSHAITTGVHDRESSSSGREEGLLTLSLGDAMWKWGGMTNLRGLISSFCVFSDTLSTSNFMTLYRKGPNDLSLFQYKCSETYDLGSKLFLYYHAKSVREGMCRNLSPQYLSKDHDNLSGLFTGQNYITWDIKAVLGSLGGVELLFPILEQVSLPVSKRRDPSETTPPPSDATPTSDTLDSAVMSDDTEPVKDDVITTSTSFTASRWFGETEGVAAFLKLLIAMLSNNENNRNGFLHSEGPATIAALLMKTPPSLLTVSAFQTIQELVELFDREEERADLYKHLIFDFRVWSRPFYSVRIGHIQYISNIVRNMGDWNQIYGIQYILDVIRVFYSGMEPGCSNDVIQLDNEEKKSITSALLMIIKYYLMTGLQADELDGLMGFIAVSQDTSLQEDLLRLLKNLLTKSDHGRDLGRMLWERGTFLLSLIQASSMPVRLITIKIVSYLMSQHNDVDGPLFTAFRDGSMAATIGHMTEPNMSSAIVIALTDLCVAKETSSYTDYISNMDVFMSMLQLLREAPLNVRNTLCQLINSILHHTPQDILRISSAPGWEIMFCWLLTPFRFQSPPLDAPTTANAAPPPPPPPATPPDSGAQSKCTTREVSPRRLLGFASLPTSRPSTCRQLENGTEVQYRSRSRAFVDGRSNDTRNYTITSDKELMDKELLKKMRKNSLHVSTPWTNTVEEDLDDEVIRTVDIVTQTFRHILWYSTLDSAPWKVWGKFFCLLEDFESEHPLVVPSYILKQKLLTLLCHDVTVELKQGIDITGTLEKLLDLSKEIEVFVISTYPSTTTTEDQEVLLLKLSHNFFPEIDIQHYSRGLQEEYLKMLMSAGIFDKEVAFTFMEIEISQSATRILLGCLASGNKEYFVTASLRLEHMIKCPFLTMKDIYFIFSNLARITQIALEEDDSEWLQYIAAILRCLFSFNVSRLKLEEYLPNLPDHRTPTFGMEFGQYCAKSEWMRYVEGQLKTAEVQYSDILMRWLQEKMKRKLETSRIAARNNITRRDAIVTNEVQYQKRLVNIKELLSEEVKRQESTDSQLRNELSGTLQKWRSTRRFFTGERGAWSSRKPESYLWKLDRTENFSRMRIRLARNYNYNTHEDASNLRDTGSDRLAATPSKEADTHLLAKVTKRSSTSLEEDDVLLEQLWSDANSPGVREELEDPASASIREKKLIKGVECSLIMLMDRIPGRLEITSKHLYFLSDQNEKIQSQTWYSTDFKIPLSQMREIHSRRYNMSRTAFEIFLVDQTNYFINFPTKKVVNTVYSTILHLRPPNLNRVGIRKPARLLRESGLTQKWIKREISNFDYLMQLNTISGRTYNDLNQYPVFPWVLKDYTSPELDLESEDVFRVLSRPVGIQNTNLEENIRIRYEEFDDPTLGKFHFGSHYSNAAGVMHYLVRIEPFTSLHIELQSGRFDFADRQFFSIPSTWANIFKSGTDQKELIPEFFYQPEFLKNINGLNLGKLQTGKILDDVILPPWASSAEDFIVKHRAALESEYVSSQLHKWIDLIFGYKQTGPEAVKACNIFNFYTYEENVNLDSIKDEKERRQVESIINNFGQTPTQLFAEPHPHRLPLDSARKTQAKGFTATFTGKRVLINLFDNLSLLKAHSVDVCENPIVFLGTPSIQTKALLVSGNPEQLVTVNDSGLLNIHGWLPFSNSKNRPFTFQFDPNAHFDRSRWQYIGGPFAQDICIKPDLFVLSPNSKYLVSGGHWDNSFRVYSVEKGKLSSRIVHHNDVVTCMSLDKAGLGDHLITGSRDTSCAIWKFGVNGVQSHPLQTLYGHDSEVLCVGISTELDLAISGAKDGTCLLHTVRQGLYIHTLSPRKGLKCEVHLAIISSIGRLVVYTEDTTHRQRLIASVLPCLHLYTVNGLLLLEKELAECINAMVIIDKYLITGNTRGFLTFRSLFTLQQLHSLNLLQPIHCISVVLDHHHKICTHILVGLASGKLIIVSVKDLVTQNKPN